MNNEIHPVDRLVGQRVRTARLTRKMSQSQLASALGVTFQQLQKYEKGTNRISASRLFDIATALEMDVGSFFQDALGTPANGQGAGVLDASLDRLDIMIVQELARLKDNTIKRHVHGILAALVEDTNRPA
jgi:transcriptional regulator with XRE-family HTH domain